MPLFILTLLAAPNPSPEDRALAFLVREVPAWSVAKKCYSCHNNGNAARALYAATRQGYSVPDKALADTTRWLANPAGWGKNGGDQAFNDAHLARLQFALALADAVDTGHVRDRQPLLDAVVPIAVLQRHDGSWAIGPDDKPGSPTTLGNTLATAEARRLLSRADATRYAGSIRRADGWLRKKPIQSVLDAAAVLLALEKADDDSAMTQRKVCQEVLQKGESKEGGWGPYVSSPPEVFDTALVVLALIRQPETDQTRVWTRRGRAYLLRTQREDGSWPETTRPAGEDSYAERLSTAGWATRALLATQELNHRGHREHRERARGRI
jgi:hypothetical protein